MSLNSSIITRNKAAKLNALASALSVKIAKEKGDPLYAKYLKLRKAYLLVKLKLIQKYGMKGKQAARNAVFRSRED